MAKSYNYSRRYRPRTPYKVRLDDGQVRFLSADQFEELFGLEWKPALADSPARALALEKLSETREASTAGSEGAPAEDLMDIEPASGVTGIEPWAWPSGWGLGEASAPDPWAGSSTEETENLVRQILRGSKAAVMGGTVVCRWSPAKAAQALGVTVGDVGERAAALEGAGVLAAMEEDGDTRTDALWADTRLSQTSLSTLKDSLEGRGAAGRAARPVSVPGRAPGVVAPTTTECVGLRLSLRPTSWPTVDGTDAGKVMGHILQSSPIRVVSGKVCAAVSTQQVADACFSGDRDRARSAVDALSGAGTLGPAGLGTDGVPGWLHELYPGLAVTAAELEAVCDAVVAGRGYDPTERPVTALGAMSTSNDGEEDCCGEGAATFHVPDGLSAVGLLSGAWPVEWGLGSQTPPDPWCDDARSNAENLLRKILARGVCTLRGGTVGVAWSMDWAQDATKTYGRRDVQRGIAYLEETGVLVPVAGSDTPGRRRHLVRPDIALSNKSVERVVDALATRRTGRKPRKFSTPRPVEGVWASAAHECWGVRADLRPASWSRFDPAGLSEDALGILAWLLSHGRCRVVADKVCVNCPQTVISHQLDLPVASVLWACEDLMEAGALGPYEATVEDGVRVRHDVRQLFPGLAVTEGELEALRVAISTNQGWGSAQGPVEPLEFDPAEDAVGEGPCVCPTPGREAPLDGPTGLASHARHAVPYVVLAVAALGVLVAAGGRAAYRRWARSTATDNH